MTASLAAEKWMIRMEATHSAAAAALRLFPEVEACAEGEVLWLRGPCDSGAIQRAMGILPGERFYITGESKLVPWGALLPVAAAPSGPWVKIANYFRSAFPPSALPGEVLGKPGLQLVRAAHERPVAMLRIAARTWLDYVNTAPAIRLAPLEFAAGDEGAVLVRGNPLPGLPGPRYTIEAGIALPCGYGFWPAVSAAVVSKLLGAMPGDMALFDVDATYAMVTADAWVPVSRSAVRISLEGISA